MSTEFAIKTSQLCRSFGSFCAVDHLDLRIREGEIFGLLGPNGAGKTTTIRMLCGILVPSSGEGHVLGYDIAHESEQIKKQIGYMSQQFSLYNDLTAIENLRFYAQIYGLPPHSVEERVRELVQMAGIQGMEDQLTVNLSGAWRQRLALACAIVHRPPMLFLATYRRGGSGFTQGFLEHDLRDGARGRDRAGHHALHGRSRILPHHRDDVPITLDRTGFPAKTEIQHARHAAGDRL
jgi:ABC-type multidrug transport system, ATPase component